MVDGVISESVDVPVPVKKKMGRPVGSGLGNYTMSEAVLAQRDAACLSRSGKLSKLDKLTAEDPELASVYKRAIVTVTQRPLIYLSKKIADIEVKIKRNELARDDKFLDPLELKALDLCMRASKILIDVELQGKRSKGKCKEMIDVTDGEVIDADFASLVD